MEIGSTVYADFGQYSSIDVRKGVVTKISPSGQVSVNFGRKNFGDGSAIIDRFTPNGELIGSGSTYFKPRLISNEVAARRVESQRSKMADRALAKAAADYRWSGKADAIAKAKEILALAEALIE